MFLNIFTFCDGVSHIVTAEKGVERAPRPALALARVHYSLVSPHSVSFTLLRFFSIF